MVSISDCRKNKDEPCDICFKAKQTRVSFPVSSSNENELFELIHCDVWGPYSVSSSSGASYFLTIVDDCSRGIWIYLMANKSEVAKLIKNFCAMTKTQFNKIVKCIRSDNGTEFTCLQHYFAEQGILFETSCVGTPQQNGRVERKHRHILNVARALRFQANLPIEFWGECILTAGYLMNRTPTTILQGKTSYEIIFGHPPIYNHIKTFGCLCFASKIPRDRNKFAARSRKCIFVGYPHGKKGWRLYDIENRDFFVSRDVVFYENHFPYSEPPPSNPNVTDSMNPAVYEMDSVTPTTSLDTADTHVEPTPPMDSSSRGTNELLASALIKERGSDPIMLEASSAVSLDDTNRPVAPSESDIRRSSRERQPSVLLKDFVCHTTRCLDPPSSSSALSMSSGTRYPIANYVTCQHFSASHARFSSCNNCRT